MNENSLLERSASAEPYLLRGDWRSRTEPVASANIQRHALKLAGRLNEWNRGMAESRFEILNNPGLQLRASPPTLVQVPLAVYRERMPVLESSWVSQSPLALLDVAHGPEQLLATSERVEEYLECGVKLVWVINPYSRTVIVHQPDEEALALDVRDELEGGSVLPGFRCDVSELFR